ncbi:phospho-sugar mutase [Planctomonas psychrotolerans]|uniref:phospho-sugar mutase n=1 Tax=Planctomonas psychrotolerans TaxID=2528712 RepID=UPI00123AE974|nr:phospho-sugar mutase [Planctomonas psychrotolerans]
MSAQPNPADRAVIADARAWLAQDPDDETRAEIQDLLDAAAGGAGEARDRALAGLHARFDTRLQFGTAGLRGAIGAGPNRMNRVLVAQTASGFADYLRGRSSRPSIVIGYDGRKNSDVFARDTAEIMAGAGVRAILLPRKLPTPVLAFAVRHLGVDAGVMVTASHNPAQDNGYKVYLGGADHGTQIVSPADRDIAAFIARAAKDRAVRDIHRSAEYTIADESVLDEYVTLTASILRAPVAPITFVYTPMHGVGWEVAERVFAEAGINPPVLVDEQVEPDATFPTVEFPNPEEPGALDLAFAKAIEVGAELILANDPDADRLAAAIVDDHGAWRRLSGNEVGALLGLGIADRYASEGRTGTFASSIVSSPALAAIARAYGFGFQETLTGFKWISRVPDLIFGFEEALGYLVDPWKVSDKDGISAALAALEGALLLKAQGRSIDSYDREFAERFGYFASDQISVRMTDLADIPRVMERLRAAPPKRIGSIPVERVDDLLHGFGDLPPSDVLRFWLAGDARVIIRPSGTEPKVKVYIDAQSTDGTAEQRKNAAKAVVTELSVNVHRLIEV